MGNGDNARQTEAHVPNEKLPTQNGYNGKSRPGSYYHRIPL